jgi:hypothetical protein
MIDAVRSAHRILCHYSGKRLKGRIFGERTYNRQGDMQMSTGQWKGS